MKPRSHSAQGGLILYVRKFTYTAQYVNPLTQKNFRFAANCHQHDD